jgi:voltage-gated potassium channel
MKSRAPGIRQVLKRVVETRETRGGRIFDAAVQVLIFFSLVAFAVETLSDLPRWMPPVLRVSEAVIVALFTIEYLLRLYVASRRPRFVFSFFGLIDLAAILPFYIAAGIDLRSLRALRLLRLFRVFKLARYSEAVARLNSAFRMAREELVLFVSISAIIVYLASVGIYYFENPAQPEKFASVFHAMWWAMSTLTTVGYGDVYPVTVGGRIFTGLVLLVGLGVVAVPAGILASALSEARRQAASAKFQPDQPADPAPGDRG